MTVWVGLVRLLLLVGLVLGVSVLPVGAQAPSPYELWVVDQANADVGGNKLYIYQARQLEGRALVGAPEVVDLQAGATDVGAGPGVRPHLLLFNNRHTHGVLAAVASGHVLFIRASDRKVVGSVDVGDQARGAVPSADDTIALVANQNGKKLARIRTDYTRDVYVHETAADLDLGALEDAEHPDNAPICPMMFVAGTRKAYVTVRGGGLYIVDTAATPMRVLKEYGRSDVAAAGCGGLAYGNKVYVNSGSATSSDLYVFDGRTDALQKRLSLTPFGTDGHGMALVGGGRYLWFTNRGNGDNVVVIDTARDEIVGVLPDVGAAPDLVDVAPGNGARFRCEPSSTAMCLAPGGARAFVSMRPPNNLTGGPTGAGERAGVSVMRIADNGRSGAREFSFPVGGDSTDTHGLAVRIVSPRGLGLPVTGTDPAPRVPSQWPWGIGAASALLIAGLAAGRAKRAAGRGTQP